MAAENSRRSQRKFISSKLSDMQEVCPQLYTDFVAEPVIQYFIASLCELEVEPKRRKRLGLRYRNTPEVRHMLHNLRSRQLALGELERADPNVIVSVLKEILTQFPGGIFPAVDDQFLCGGGGLSLKSSLELALDYVIRLVDSLPLFLRQFTYLVCKSLANLARQSDSPSDAYTDLLLLFTPVLFPNVVAEDVSKFLRATRITLILVDMCDKVFLSCHSADTIIEESPLSISVSDSAYSSDEDFFRDIFDSLERLQMDVQSAAATIDDNDCPITSNANSQEEEQEDGGFMDDDSVALNDTPTINDTFISTTAAELVIEKRSALDPSKYYHIAYV